MKNILFILHYPPPVHGAAVVGKYLKESKLLNEQFNTRYINLSTSLIIEDIEKRGLIKVYRYFKLLYSVLKSLISFSPDLVYISLTSSGIGFYKDATIALIVKAFSKKLVYHFHNKGVEKFGKRPLANFLYGKVFKNAEVILLSKLLFFDIKKYVPVDRVHYCPNGIPKKSISISSEGKSRKTAQILFLSNLIESKGVYILLEACQILDKRGVQYYCSFVGGEGDVSSEAFWNKVNDLKLSSSVNYLGKKYNIEKELVFSKSDIFAFPTFYHNETFGLVLLEAMQFSLPTISTFEGGIPGVVDNGVTGFLMEKCNAEVLANYLEVLIKNPRLREKMGKKGYERYNKLFTLELFEHRFVTIMKKLI